MNIIRLTDNHHLNGNHDQFVYDISEALHLSQQTCSHAEKNSPLSYSVIHLHDSTWYQNSYNFFVCSLLFLSRFVSDDSSLKYKLSYHIDFWTYFLFCRRASLSPWHVCTWIRLSRYNTYNVRHILYLFWRILDVLTLSVITYCVIRSFKSIMKNCFLHIFYFSGVDESIYLSFTVYWQI